MMKITSRTKNRLYKTLCKFHDARSHCLRSFTDSQTNLSKVLRHPFYFYLLESFI